MATLTIELPEQQAQTVFNLRRWEELLADPELAKMEGRIETDRHGHIIMSPAAASNHGRFQYRIGTLLERLMVTGEVLTECPISTADGVRAADVVWSSPECTRRAGNRACFTEAPDICVEVLSPSNTKSQIDDKMALCFNAGAKEVWLCSQEGEMSFYGAGRGKLENGSIPCPRFPKRVAGGAT